MTSPSIEAISLARAAFSSAQGDLGLIKFSVDELTPDTSTDTSNPRIWNLVCSFYENLGSGVPSKYKAVINLDTKGVSITKIEGGDIVRRFVVSEEGAGVSAATTGTGELLIPGGAVSTSTTDANPPGE